MEQLASVFLGAAELVEEMPPFSFGRELLKMGAGLIVLLGLVFVCTYLIRKFGRGRIRAFNQSHVIQILERRPIGPKAVLYLLSIRGKEILIGYSPQGITPLYPLTAPSHSASFEEILDKKLKR